MGCLDPPIMDEADQPPSEKEWFCPSCIAEQVSPLSAPDEAINEVTFYSHTFLRYPMISSQAPPPPLPQHPSPFDYLNTSMQTSIPRVFALPRDLIGYFKNGKFYVPKGLKVGISSVQSVTHQFK